MSWQQPSADDKACLCVHVVRASSLPKTDRFSSIDPYLKIRVSGDSQGYQTKKFDNNPNPVWDQKFPFTVPLDLQSQTPVATVVFELMDEDTIKDSSVGFAEVNLSPAVFSSGVVKLPFGKWAKSKYASSSAFLEVRLSFVYAFETLVKHVKAGYPELKVNQKDQRLYFPLGPAWGPFWLGIEYEKDSIDVKLFLTQSDTSYFLDMGLFTQKKTRIRRRVSSSAIPISHVDLSFFEELKMDDMPFSSDFSQLKIFRFRKACLARQGLDEVVKRHGWKGALNYKKASKLLTGVECDPAEQEIFMPLPGCLLAVDYDEDDVDMKCLVLDTPDNNNKAYDLTITVPDVKKKSDVYSPPTTVFHRYQVQRRLELDDVPYGTKFKEMVWYQYELSDGISSSLSDLIRVKPGTPVANLASSLQATTLH